MLKSAPKANEFRILHLEDSSKVREAVRSRAPKNWKIDHAATYEEAIKLMAENKYHALILDVNVPESTRGTSISSKEHDEFMDFCIRNGVNSKSDLVDYLQILNKSNFPKWIQQRHLNSIRGRCSPEEARRIAEELHEHQKNIGYGKWGIRLFHELRETKPMPIGIDELQPRLTDSSLTRKNVMQKIVQAHSDVPTVFFSDAYVTFMQQVHGQHTGNAPQLVIKKHEKLEESAGDAIEKVKEMLAGRQ